jgi:hypothetical protein
VIDIVIPTIPGREESLDRCRKSYADLAGVESNVIVVPDSKTCGWGWKQGLAASREPYVLLACDDQEAFGAGWAQDCIAAIDEGFLPCPRVWTPEGRIESQGGDMSAYRHLIARHQKNRTPVDYTTIPVMSREQADAIQMIESHYCSDVWVSYRGRQLGIETVLVHGFDVRHHQERVGRGAGMAQEARDAMDVETLKKELEACESLSPAA